MINPKTRQEAELMKKVRDAYRRIIIPEREDTLRELGQGTVEYIFSTTAEACRYMVGLGPDKLEKIMPGTRIILQQNFRAVNSFDSAKKVLETYEKVIPEIWRIRRYRQTQELSDKIPGEI